MSGSQVKPGAKPQQMYLEGLRYALDRDGKPFYLELGEGADKVTQLPLFRNVEQMGRFYYETQGPGVLFEGVVEHGAKFLAGVPGDVEIVLEPRRNEQGKWEYEKILRD